MREHIAAEFLLATLNKVDVCQHTVFLERFGQFIRDRGVGVEAGEGDELENKSEAALAQ
jgi:hypothetical protein